MSFQDRRPDVSLHFQVRTESHVLLTEAAELADTEAARIEASVRLPDLLKQHAGRIWADEEWQMDVTDEAGLILFVLHLSALRTSATMDDPRQT